ncbi:phosphatidylglycerophosphatase A family protein [Geomonas anaerohicana]|uniref:Phosphatidylglycerophosphatase A n=1 Tax=Geomonas anaerohicana TaxID=2798583 RepID=A0ABS0YJ29_9BACT|nr:phosphatidylglycerophosphatase A [Geomonas anaerohicana]MBJ6752352.1 phosphatidylglycerophosphatase A [Geomonas anaerohicana]
MKKFVIITATWFGTGFSPFASGTVGTVGAIPLFLLLSGMPLWLYLVTTVAFTLFACWSAGFGEELWGEHDSGKIVIDEVAGYLVTMTAVPVTWQGILAGFIMFRIFDILKPQPARWFDRSLKNGYGVVLDDIVAGIYACAATHLVLRLL